MKERLKTILANMKKYNDGCMSRECFGFEPDVVYDAMVVAPGWKPTKIIHEESYHVTQLTQHSYFSGYLVEKDGLKIAWAQTASGACNLLDHCIILGELQFQKLIFVGAVGSLVPELDIGDFCTPSCSVAGVYAHQYLCDSLDGFTPFRTVYPKKDYVDHVVSLARKKGYELKKAKVFCTDSISCEYSHLDEIKATGAQLIEMETSTFYQLADLFDVPAIALLAVSDNSATGMPLLGQNRDQHKKYSNTRSNIVPDMIVQLAKEQMDKKGEALISSR